MSTTPTSAAMPPPPPVVDEDTFERDLKGNLEESPTQTKEMLKDGPSLNDLSSTVQGGIVNMDGKPQAFIRPDNQNQRGNNMPGQPGMPRSPSLPPGDIVGCVKYGVMRPECSPVATSNISLSSPERNGNMVGGQPAGKGTVSQPTSKLDTIRSWTINTYKCTRQMVSERFGKGSRTVDLELEAQIEALRDTQRKYANVLRLARAMTNHFYHVVQTQRAMGDCFSELSQKSPELQEEFAYNSETQKALCKNGEVLLGALNFFTSSVNTLCNKTMEDTLQTIKQYETARVECDAYRTDMEALQLGPRDSNTMPHIEDAQRKFSQHKEKYDRLRGDVAIKLKFLEENKVKVMHKQLLLFHNAIAAYFTGNQSALEATLKQFNIKLKAPNTEKPSWIEQN